MQLPINVQAKDTTLQEAVRASKVALQYIQRQRFDIVFDTFFEQVLTASTDLTDPLPRS